MEVENNARLLMVRQILFEETDENNHDLSMSEMIEKLTSIFPDATFDKRTIKSDIELLDTMDFEVIRNKGKRGKILYSHQNRIFETYQLRLIIDAILSAKFITDKEKNNLIEKVKKLTSKHIAKSLPNPIVFSQSANMDYELVKLNIDYIHRAISEQKIITYQYGKYNVDKQFAFNRDGAIYRIEPYGLIWQNDFYYLIARYLDNGELRHYRLDRIRNISISDETFVKQPFDLHSYINQSFHMFAGEEIRIKIQFHMDLVNVVLDRFGHEVDIRRTDDHSFILTTKAKLSDGLINWILTWGNKAKVLAPEHLVESVHEKIKQMMEVYE
ncbi:helix-turn-helix transcriptional regulator [Oceanobacillus sp. FSL H7-0719]|uniref:helix-turn-helix transcriptional regulator n=1 Tax=Oceanobacillus sp. FSL H7-0719 TaxID=2954507 RepID=UPI00324351C8